MARLSHWILLAAVLFILICPYETASPFFLQAITSALTTIPLTGGPMTSGLVGAKLAIGSKLLYYLGFFGRGQSKPKSTATKKSGPKKTAAAKGASGGRPALPLPYAMSGAGGSGGGGGFGQGPFGGMDPAQLFQMLTAQGIDPITAMQVVNSQRGPAGANAAFPFPPGGGANQGPSGLPGGAGGSFGNTFPTGSGGGFGNFQGGGFGNMPGGAGGFGNVPGGSGNSGGFGNVPGGGGFEGMPHDVSNVLPPSDLDDTGEQGDGSEDDIESFFTFLRDMDDNTCISRLVCDIGADPSFLGEFSENIHGIISTLDLRQSGGAAQYIAIMETGKREGGCDGRFPQCTDTAYEIVKNVAPTVGIPDNINPASLNQLGR